MKKLFTATYFSNGENIETKTIKAETIAKAREKANSYVIAETCDTVRIHERLTDTDGNILENTLQKTALLIAKKSAEKSIERTGGNDAQIRICDNLKKACAIILNYESVTNEKSGLKLYHFVGYKEDKNGELQKVKSCDILAENQTKAEEQKPQGNFDFVTFEKQSFSDKMCQALETLCSDSMEYYGQAQTALCQAIAEGEDTHEQYRKAYLAINEHIKKLQKNTGRLSIEYLTTENQDIIAIDSFFGKLLSGKAEWVNFDYIGDKGLTDDEKKALANAVVCAMQKLPKVQRQIILYRVKNLSIKQIIEKLYTIDENKTSEEKQKLYENRKRLVLEHINQAQKNILSYIKQTDESVLKLLVYTNIHISKYKSSDRHRDGYWKEYRARKKAGL